MTEFVRAILVNFLKKHCNSIYNILINELAKNFTYVYRTSGYRTWRNTYWLGKKSWKCPLDLWIYQEIIYDLKPDIIVESGTFKGGTALYLANICDLVNKGIIITIDIVDLEDRPKHNRIKYLTGSSTSNEITSKVKKELGNNDRVMVILDSNHSKNHVLNELRIYSKMVTKGSYLIIEDTNLDGPRKALKAFLKENKDFFTDKSKNKFFLTFNPKGFLKKVK